MNSLTLFCLVAAASSYGAAHYLGYPGAYGFLPYNYLGATPYAHYGLPYSLGPVKYNAATVVAPVAPVHTQYHAQDELGQYSFGYAGGPSSRAETRDAYGRVTGSYNYVDSEGKVQTQHYVADALGFRVSGTNLPVAPDAPEAPALVAPEPVQDTPEVAAAKAEFRTAYDEAAAAAEAAPYSRKKRSVVAPAPYPYHHPLRFSYAFSAPLFYNYPALHYSAGYPAHTSYAVAPPATVRDATLLRVVHNPGHAVSYRVD
ncbi:cuticle protein 16.8-like [Scylla paramamosain]|uniref:cuticle protein 16.8-like n=1 Tax=Scylla paramamosain TaxID=85552 RepID=UPI003082F7E1